VCALSYPFACRPLEGVGVGLSPAAASAADAIRRAMVRRTESRATASLIQESLQTFSGALLPRLPLLLCGVVAVAVADPRPPLRAPLLS
jgi:hypothetical protein